MKKVWYDSEILQEFRELSPEDIEGLCKECKELKKCRGGCPIRREIETGNIKIGPDFRCILKNRLKANQDVEE